MTWCRTHPAAGGVEQCSGAVVPAGMERAGVHSGLRHYGQGTVPNCGGGSGIGPRVGGQDGEGQMR